MPSTTLSTQVHADLKDTRDTHGLTSLDKAAAHWRDEHKKAHITAPPSPPPLTPIESLQARVILVVPKDMNDGQLVNTDYGSFTIQQGVDWLHNSWCKRFNEWLKPSGFAVNFDVLHIVSQYTTTEMRVPGTVDKAFSWSFTPNFVAAEHPTLVADKAAGKFRHMFVAIGGEGFAGGACVHPGNMGWGIIGDWELGRLTGIEHPFGSNVDKDGRSWSHELLHVLGVYCHAGNWFDQGEFAVPVHEQIDTRFTSFPLNDWGLNPDGTLRTTYGGQSMYTDEHWLGETRLYSGAVEQMKKFSGPWLKKL